ncbi:PREDICTED: UPF0600 protein C5orf51 homolog [Tinamus guttatus]|uniref:UPF0600 protein C5orf51 homolog n=1 Tax=Tinamus guttatus TaxID=94827 RepID=UPI00052EFB3D|nr:PREDICTED: UPF0600 protein C5orf51 homolog [Tinamus guttatus]
MLFNAKKPCVLPLDTFLVKDSAALEKLKDFCKEEKEKTYPFELLQLYMQAVLDITYFEENQLVDEDFPEDYSLQKLKELICILSEPEDLMKECNINECQCSKGGNLLFGIFSDTHLLAMMYSGEMCYWGLKHCTEGRPGSLETADMAHGRQQSAAPDFRGVGTKALETYVAACEGPLKGQGWKSASARQISWCRGQRRALRLYGGVSSARCARAGCGGASETG